MKRNSANAITKKKEKNKRKSREQTCEICGLVIKGGHLAIHKERKHSYKKEVKKAIVKRIKKGKHLLKKNFPEARTAISTPYKKAPTEAEPVIKSFENLISDKDEEKELKDIKPRLEKVESRVSGFKEKVSKMDFSSAQFVGCYKRKSFHDHLHKANKQRYDKLSENIYSLRAYRCFAQMLLCKGRMLEDTIDLLDHEFKGYLKTNPSTETDICKHEAKQYFLRSKADLEDLNI